MQAATQAATGAMTQAATTAPAMPVLAPSYSFSYPAGSVNGVALSYDGESLLLVRRHTSIDAWDALTYWWPEAAIALALFALLVIGMRISRRPNSLREPHCRKCGYLLRNLIETRCPECGYERATERPRFGQRRGWRIATLIIIGLAYAYVARFGYLRTIRPTFFGWFDWPRDDWVQRAQTSMQWLKACTINCSSLTRQPISGGLERVLVVSTPGEFGGPLLLQRGKTLALCGRHEVTLVDAATGDVIERLHLDKRHGCLHPSTRISHAAAVTESDQPFIWVLLNTGSVRKWNVETDESEEVLYLKTYDGRGFAEPLAAGGRVALPTFLTHTPSLHVLNEPSGLIDVRTDRWRGGWCPSLSPSGDLLAWNINEEGHASIELLSRKDGTLIRSLHAPVMTAWSSPPLFAPDGSCLIATVRPNTTQTWIADVASGVWIAELSPSGIAHSNRTYAVNAKPSRIVRTGHGTTFVVDVFDLDRIQALP